MKNKIFLFKKRKKGRLISRFFYGQYFVFNQKEETTYKKVFRYIKLLGHGEDIIRSVYK